MDRIVTVGVDYLGRLLRTSGGDFKMTLYVSRDKQVWDKKVDFPVTFNGVRFVVNSNMPLSPQNNKTNNKIYENLSNDRSIVDIKVEEFYRYYRVTSDCITCKQIYPDRVDTQGDFIVAEGNIENID